MKPFFSALWRIISFWSWPAAYRRYVDKVCTSGYAAEPSTIALLVARLLFPLAIFYFLGRIRIVGQKNARLQGRFIFCPNHTTMLDPIVMYGALRHRFVRAVSAHETFRALGGLTGIFLSKLGVMPVDRSHGKTVMVPLIDLMVRGESLEMFPEAKISPSGKPLPYKLGAAVISNAAFDQLGGLEAVGIVPVYIDYHSRHEASALNFWKMGFHWRGGVTVTFCEPIWLADLEDRDPSHVMELVRKSIEACRCSKLPR